MLMSGKRKILESRVGPVWRPELPVRSHLTLTCYSYYVWDIDKEKPLILVSESQVEHLLNEVNIVLKLSLKITDQQREDGLVTRFPDHPNCRPRYLGRSYIREEYNTMVDSVPGATFRASGESIPPPLPGGTLEDFRQLMEELWELQKGKSKAQKKKKQQERIAKQQSMANSFKRAQRYLGLRPTVQDGKWPFLRPSCQPIINCLL